MGKLVWVHMDEKAALERTQKGREEEDGTVHVQCSYTFVFILALPFHHYEPALFHPPDSHLWTKLSQELKFFLFSP